jgi:hypothetical protein
MEPKPARLAVAGFFAFASLADSQNSFLIPASQEAAATWWSSAFLKCKVEGFCEVIGVGLIGNNDLLNDTAL